MSPLKVEISGLRPRQVEDGDSLVIREITPPLRVESALDGSFGNIRHSSLQLPLEGVQVDRRFPEGSGIIYARKSGEDISKEKSMEVKLTLSKE